MAMAMKGVPQMGIRIDKEDAPNVDSYVDTMHSPTQAELEEMFVEENENDTADRSSTIQSGWAAAKKAVAKSNEKYANDFKFTEDVQLIKFISGEPMTFMQHWVNRQGKRSFISIGEGDPLIAVGSKPDQKFAFSVVNLSAEEPKIELMVVGVRLCGQLEKLHTDKKTGPLDRPDLYWAVSKSGTGTKTAYSISPVKERDLADDWEIDPVAASELIKTMKPLGPEALHIPTKAELEEIAREIAGQL
jgi:hypothetical protein